MKKRKLLLASDCFLPRWDGIARFLSEIIPELKKYFSLTLIAPDFPKSKKTYKGVKIIRIKTYNFQVGDYSPPRIQIKLIKEIVSKHDIVFSQTIGPIGAMSVIQGKRFNKQVFSFIHSLEWELFSKIVSKPLQKSVHKISKRFVRHVYNQADRLIVSSREVRDEIRGIGVKTKTNIVKLGVDLKKFSSGNKRLAKKKIGIPVKNRVIGYAGRIGKEKDLPTIIKAYKEIKKKRDDISLLIVGGGITDYDEQMKLEGVIRYNSTDNIINFLRAMDVYVLASHTETSSLSTMEAMACKIPVFVTGVGETRLYVKERKTGFKFKIYDSNVLAKKILRVIDNKKLLDEIGKNAREIIKKRYDWNNSSKKIVQILKKNL